MVDRLVAVGAMLLCGNHEADYVGGRDDPALRAAWGADPVSAALAWYLDRLGPGERPAALARFLADEPV